MNKAQRYEFLCKYGDTLGRALDDKLPEGMASIVIMIDRTHQQFSMQAVRFEKNIDTVPILNLAIAIASKADQNPHLTHKTDDGQILECTGDDLVDRDPDKPVN